MKWLPRYVRRGALCCLLSFVWQAGATVCAAPTDEVAALVDATLGAPERLPADLERDFTSAPAAVMAFCGVAPGMHVLDLWSGSGYWSELFAGVVGRSGEVVAHDSAAARPYTGEAADARFAGKRLPRVRRLTSEVDDLRLGRARFDLIFISLAYHELYVYTDAAPVVGRERVIAQLRTALKPDGAVVIIDHAAATGRGVVDTQALHRIEEAWVRRDFDSNGFRFVDASRALANARDNHVLDVFDPGIRGRTDRMLLRFERAPDPPPESAH